MAKNIIDIWKSDNPRLPLVTENYIVNKLKNTSFETAHQINKRCLSSLQKKILVKKLDTLSAISSCSCLLTILCYEERIVKQGT